MTAAQPTKYYWLVTLQGPDASGGQYLGTSEGTIDAQPGTTRQQLVRDILIYARQLPGAPASANVVFLYLEPNELTA